jgi:GNAT superfamily N-acetyltransferase
MKIAERKISVLLSLGALCFFVVSVFQIADGKLLLGAVFFAGAACMLTAMKIVLARGDTRTVEEDAGDPASSDEFWKDLFLVRPLEKTETGKALQLAWKVFCEFESPDYAPEGTEEFKRCLNDDAYLAGIRYYGAFDEDKLVGVLGIREEKAHICFFFVDGEVQRLGIGTKLFRRMRKDFPERTITLNSSPYGLPFYKALGFTATDSEKTVNGIRFTPMVFREGA